MIKNVIKAFALATVITATPVAANAASAEDFAGVYVEPKVAWNLSAVSHVKHDNEWTAGVAAGYSFAPKFEIPVRAELEYMHVGNHLVMKEHGNRIKERGDILMANLAYDFDFVPYVTPYVTAGAGIAWNEHSAGSFAGNVGAGVLVPVTEKLGVDLECRWVMMGKHRFETVRPRENGMNVALGIRYAF